MASNVFGAKTFKPTPPAKGSFPLDHEGLCKEFYLKFMICINENQGESTKCREDSKNYLECRMNKNLMAKESLESLGYKDLIPEDKKE